ncbi:Crp/Fnr family transcriptional regulator [Loktanella sp. M215]|uniref:Crp/Fnr family transcriptional regulator n=1 Tax=Loktanella sp. M215 TaxID=2675431 RepID=UPI001F18AD47|nr:Crp/Fnr family transcriptional regulator [Loktanella sp. M215]MCF7701769.1 helix-turn-helix domain-containing protein [Loktanella sp. M215]
MLLPSSVNTTMTQQSVLSELLDRLKSEPCSYLSGCDLQHEGDRPQNLYYIQSGWVYAYVMLADGQRQILYLYQPGDIAGLSDVGMDRISCSLVSLSDCVVHAIPMKHVVSSQVLTPGVSVHLLQKSAEVQSCLMRTLVAIGRMTARQRVVWLILMFQDKLHQRHMVANIVDVPFNQSELGDLIGLTNVSVSKVLCDLSNEGFIERKGSQIRLRRRSDLEEMIHYHAIRRLAPFRGKLESTSTY